MWYEKLPHLNAALNGASALLLAIGYRAIRRKDVATHLRCMLSAFSVSIAFLASYLTYHALAGHRPYTGTGVLRSGYILILVSHIVLAALTLPLSVTTLWFALRGRFDKHRRIARWTFPIWMYVSVTGVIVYVMLYWL